MLKSDFGVGVGKQKRKDEKHVKRKVFDHHQKKICPNGLSTRKIGQKKRSCYLKVLKKKAEERKEKQK